MASVTVEGDLLVWWGRRRRWRAALHLTVALAAGAQCAICTFVPNMNALESLRWNIKASHLAHASESVECRAGNSKKGSQMATPANQMATIGNLTAVNTVY